MYNLNLEAWHAFITIYSSLSTMLSNAMHLHNIHARDPCTHTNPKGVQHVFQTSLLLYMASQHVSCKRSLTNPFIVDFDYTSTEDHLHIVQVSYLMATHSVHS